MAAKQWCYFFGMLLSVPLWLGLVPELSIAASKFAVTSDNPIIFGFNILVVLIAVYLGELS
uniref:Uncharacterized protein n=1 Tax=Vibrio genomosp. F6 TaxID=723172 RepID=A0A0H3ZM13_9VIBR|nr:hypothetical protein [Vibrio genomosp. F6]